MEKTDIQPILLLQLRVSRRYWTAISKPSTNGAFEKSRPPLGRIE
jgi:hypothetical protein